MLCILYDRIHTYISLLISLCPNVQPKMFCSFLKKTKVILKSNTLVPLLCIRSLHSVLTVCKMHLISFVSTVRKILSGTWREKGRRRKWKRRVYRKRGKGTGSKGGLGKIRRFYNGPLYHTAFILFTPQQPDKT